MIPPRPGFDAYRRAATSLAPTLDLVLLLHRSIAVALDQAADEMDQGEKGTAAERVDRALLGLGELAASCEPGAGASSGADDGAAARGIYASCRELLVRAACDGDAEGMRAVAESVRTLHEGWANTRPDS